MKIYEVGAFIVGCEVRADMQKHSLGYSAKTTMRGFHQFIFRDHCRLSNIVMPTGQEGAKANLCCVFDQAEGTTGLPPNTVVNDFMEGVLGDSGKTFHGTVVMFYINRAGTRISCDFEDVAELTHLIRCMKIAIETGDEDLWHSEFFVDSDVVEQES